MNVKDVISDMP